MKKIYVLLVVMICVSSAFALGPKPYVGVNLQSNSPTGDFKGDDLANDQGGAKSGIGGEVDLGISASMASAYLGYRFGKFDAKSKGEIEGVGEVSAEGEFKVNRWVVGVRWHVLGGVPTPVMPTIGGGITIGKTDASAIAEGQGEHQSIDESSKSSIGWFLEGGVIVRAIGNLSLVGDLQYHSFDAESDNELYNGTLKVSFFTLQVGARFMIL